MWNVACPEHVRWSETQHLRCHFLNKICCIWNHWSHYKADTIRQNITSNMIEHCQLLSIFISMVLTMCNSIAYCLESLLKNNNILFFIKRNKDNNNHEYWNATVKSYIFFNRNLIPYELLHMVKTIEIKIESNWQCSIILLVMFWRIVYTFHCIDS
jgi:hypothetical protein